jgi:hypothetical protein
MKKAFIATAAAVVSLCIFSSLCNVQLAHAQEGEQRVWTIEEILAERTTPKEKRRPRMCRGGAFKPCVCPKDVPTLVQYRPSVRECGGNAAIILSGKKYMSIYSVVVRDWENKDRWPPQGANGCTSYETNVLGLNKCSVFKVQQILSAENEVRDAEVHCLGASGYSPLFNRVSRMTAKFKDIPNSTADPLARWCLAGPSKPLN